MADADITLEYLCDNVWIVGEPRDRRAQDPRTSTTRSAASARC